MKKIVKIKGVILGEGMPKICVPLVGTNSFELIEEAKYIRGLDFDVVEWRVDFFEDVEDISRVKEELEKIRDILIEKPLVFTFRSSREGGEKEISKEYYAQLNKAIVEEKLAEVVDVELFTDEEVIKEIVKSAHENNVAVIISNHDFSKTPTKDEIIARLLRARELGADIPKIAVMPNSTKDVITLLDATCIMNEQYNEGPIITMSMAGKGVVSRLAGELFGSALTFGAAKKVSAPGQISVVELRKTIQLIHNYL